LILGRLPDRRWNRPLADRQHLNANNIPFRIVVGIDPGLNLPRAGYFSIENLKIGSVCGRIELEFHKSAASSSKNAVTTTTGSTVSL